ncbi:MAG TPA: GtrA family protein [Anaerolineaceae bacterium]
MKVNQKKEVSRFLRFAIVGAIGAVVDFAIFNLLATVMGMRPLVAQVFSFATAVVSNFIWNRLWTYPDSRSKPIQRQMVQFLIISVIGLLIRTPLFAFLEPNLIRLFGVVLPANFFFTPVFAGHNGSLAIAIIVVMFWNFIANRLWTYNDVDQPIKSIEAQDEREQSPTKAARR